MIDDLWWFMMIWLIFCWYCWHEIKIICDLENMNRELNVEAVMDLCFQQCIAEVLEVAQPLQVGRGSAKFVRHGSAEPQETSRGQHFFWHFAVPVLPVRFKRWHFHEKKKRNHEVKESGETGESCWICHLWWQRQCEQLPESDSRGSETQAQLRWRHRCS